MDYDAGRYAFIGAGTFQPAGSHPKNAADGVGCTYVEAKNKFICRYRINDSKIATCGYASGADMLLHKTHVV